MIFNEQEMYSKKWKKKLRKSEIMVGKNSNSLNKIQKIKKIFLDN